MLGKVYFSDGTTKPILNYIIHSKYDVEFYTEDGQYQYIGLIEDYPEAYIKTSQNMCCKLMTHRFYKIVFIGDAVAGYERTVIPVDIDKIEIVYGEG